MMNDRHEQDEHLGEWAWKQLVLRAYKIHVLLEKIYLLFNYNIIQHKSRVGSNLSIAHKFSDIDIAMSRLSYMQLDEALK